MCTREQTSSVITVSISVLQYDTVTISVLQYDTVTISVLQYDTVSFHTVSDNMKKRVSSLEHRQVETTA